MAAAGDRKPLTDEEREQMTGGKHMSDEARARVRATLAAPVWPTSLERDERRTA